MNDWVLGIYHRLPQSLRSTVASLRGWHLRSWRYSDETDALVAEILEQEHWSAEKWQDYHNDRLSELLHLAATKVPFYKQQWDLRRRQGDRASWEYLENWHILEKDTLRKNAQGFIVDGTDKKKLFHKHTSGTTGKSLDIWCSKKDTQIWYALVETRTRQWFGLSREDRFAMLGGQLVTPVQQRRPPFWVWNAPLRQLYMSSYHLRADYLPAYIDALRQYNITYLYGYTSSLYELALEIIRLGGRDLRMKVVLTNAEPVFSYQREKIEEAFQCPLRETYGMAETVAAASECDHGKLHWWPEVARAELVRQNQFVTDGHGELVATGLLNTAMPLIRYRVGDQVTFQPDDSRCSCGRTLPLLASVEGRVDDLLYTLDGRCIGRLDPVFKANLPVREAQIVQEDFDQVRLRYVPEPGFTHATGKSLIARLQSRMGNVKVILEQIEEIPRGANGKFRAVICNIPVKPR